MKGAPWIGSLVPWIGSLAVLLASTARAQEMDLGLTPAPVHGQQVQYVAEAQVVPAGREAFLELHFAVRAGFHVNSHTPKSELLLPTRLDLSGTDIRLGNASYPAGKPFHLADEVLDVYADNFVVRLPVRTGAGSHQLQGALHYQACDRAACFPPKTLPISVVFEAK